MTTTASTNSRLHPRRSDSRYFGLVRLRQAMEQAIASHIAPLNDKPTAVDLGCGTMPYRPLFEPHVSQYIGVDLPGNDLAEMTFDAATGRVDLPNGTAGVVISTQVLEHVESPGEYLDETHRLCDDGGLLILSTHGLFKYHEDPHDYWRWTGQGLAKLLQRHGWQTVQLIGVLGFAAAAWQLWQDSLVMKLPRIGWLRQVVATIMQQGVGLADLMYRPNQRTENAAVYLIVAKRVDQPCR